MRIRKMVSLFAGGGLYTEGAKQAGLTPIGAIEHDRKKAEIYKLNHGRDIVIRDTRTVTDEEWSIFRHCWMLQASPPCKNSSRAKRHESQKSLVESMSLDIALAASVNRAIKAVCPQHFLLENVGEYAATESYRSIILTLERSGYTWRQFRLNSADFGVPQSRDRLYLIAALDGELIERLDFSAYTRPRMGWYEGIERHLGSCKEKTLAPYQVAAIQRSLEAGKMAENDIAILVGGAGSNTNKPGVTHWSSPSPTVRACEGIRSGGWRPCIVYQKDFNQPVGEAVGYKLSGRCLLALQGVPDAFIETTDTVSCFVAGNGVSVPVARAIVQTMIGIENRLEEERGERVIA